MNAYPTLPGCIGPHNPIIPDKNIPLSRIFLDVILTSKAVGQALFSPAAVCVVQQQQHSFLK